MKQASLLGIALVRIISGAIEMMAAVYILRHGSLRTALRANAALGIVGPAALVLGTLIGAAGLGSELRPQNVALVFIGVLIIILATQ